MSKKANQSPYDASVNAIWQDPTAYDHFQHGPPYLPTKTASSLVSRVASRYSVISSNRREEIRRMADTLPFNLQTRMELLLSHFLEEYGNKPFSELGAVLSFLRASAFSHQTHHWLTRGQSFYGDHLLFDRIYESVIKDIDAVAERLVGTPGSVRTTLHPVTQSHQMSTLIASMQSGKPEDPQADDYARMSLMIELSFIIFVDIVVDSLKSKNQLSRGTDNLLAGIQDTHESHIYLLKQRLGD